MAARPPNVPTRDELDRWELSVAQRADELARLAPTARDAARDREMWLQAEAELFAVMAAHSSGAPQAG